MTSMMWDGGDVQAAGRTGYMDPDEEKRMREREQAQAQASQVPDAVRGYEAQRQQQRAQAPRIQSDSGMNGSDSPRPPQRGPQPTFNDLQKQGRPRPAPQPTVAPEAARTTPAGGQGNMQGRMQEMLGAQGQQMQVANNAAAPAANNAAAPANFDVGQYLQNQLTGLPNAAMAPGWNPTLNTSGLMAMNAAAQGMPGSAYNPGQFNAQGYMSGLTGAVNAAAGNLAPAMYGAGSTSARTPGMYGQTGLPQFTQQALSAGGLDVASELANLYRTGSRGVSDEVSQQISQSLANPSAYTNERVQEIYGQLGQNIDDEFAQRETALREEMAARGLADSSIQGGRLADLNVGRRSAQQGLAAQLGQQAAQDFASARSAAIGQGMQRDAANLGATTGMLNQLLGTQQAGANLGFQNFDAQMQRSQLQNAMDRGRFADALSGQQFQSNVDQQRFDMNRGRFQDQLANAQFQQGARQQNVQNQLGLGNQALNFFNANAALGQQGFQNQMGLAQARDQLTGNRFARELQGLGFLGDREQQGFQNELARSQFNQQAGDQRYNQGLGYLDRFMGYGQQAFQNDMTQAEFNRALQNDQDRMMMAMLGLGG